MEWVELVNFRLWERFRLDLSPRQVYLQGANGVGKTSVLEAMFLMSRLHSFRTRQWREITRHGSAYWRVESDVGAVEWREEMKRFFLPNNVPASAGELYGRVAAVYMSTGDGHWLLSGGDARRAWLDGLIALEEPGYMDVLRRWRRVLAQRNAWLRSETFDARVGEALEPIYLSAGWEVTEARRRLFQRLTPLLCEFAKGLSEGTRVEYAFDYRPCFDVLPVSLSDRLEQERALGYSLQGPHRDDWTIKLNDRPLEKYGSEGQIQVAALAIKLAEMTLIQTRRGTPPWLLMDDILAPLDGRRRVAFIDVLPKDVPMIFVSPCAPDSALASHFHHTLNL